MHKLNLAYSKPTHSIIFYDGVCGLCDKSVQFIIKRDKKRLFKYATLQSEIAKEFLGAEYSFDSFVLFENNKAYFKSDAALRVIRKLPRFWPLLYSFIIVPSFIRNGIYNFIAANRYKWFGKYKACIIPTKEQQSLFIQ